jgi:hypothetical protein
VKRRRLALQNKSFQIVNHQFFLGLPLVVLLVFFCFFSLNLKPLLYLVFGYSWSLAVVSSKLQAQAAQKSYRFSFLRFTFAFNRLVNRVIHVPAMIKQGDGLLSLVLFTGFLSLIFNNSEILIYCVLGGFLASAIILLKTKLSH